jgi:hypothetical protein
MSRKVVPFSVADEPAPIIVSAQCDVLPISSTRCDHLCVQGFFHAVASFHALPADMSSADKQTAMDIASTAFQDEVLQLYSDEVIAYARDWRLDSTVSSNKEAAAVETGNTTGVVHPDIFDQMQESVDQLVSGEYPVDDDIEGDAEADLEAEEAPEIAGEELQEVEGEEEEEEDGRLTLDEQIAFQQAFMNWKNGVDDGGLALIGHAADGGKPSNNKRRAAENGKPTAIATTVSTVPPIQQQNGAAAGSKRGRGEALVPTSVQQAKRRQHAGVDTLLPTQMTAIHAPGVTTTGTLTKEALEQVAVSVAAAAASAVVQALGNASNSRTSPPDTTAVGARYDELTAWYWAGYHAGRAAALEGE